MIIKMIKKLLNNKADRSELEKLRKEATKGLNQVSEEIFGKISKKIMQPDWKQNDTISPDFIKNRTHFSTTVTIFDIDVSGLISFDPEINLVANKQYIMVVNGVEHNVTSGIDDNNGLPYVDITIGDVRFHSYTIHCDISGLSEGESWHVILKEEIINYLDEKYIPDTIARRTEIPELANADWNQNDPNSLSYVNNRTHYEDSTTLMEINMKYYGPTAANPDQSEHSIIDEETAFEFRKLISDHNGKKLILDVDGTQITVNAVISVNSSNVTVNYWLVDEDNNIVVYNRYANGTASVKFVTLESGEFGLGTAGEPCTVKIILPIVNQLDEKFIPMSIARVSDLPHDSRVTKEILPKTSFTYSGVVWRGSATNYFILEYGKTYEVIFDDNYLYYCVCTANSGYNDLVTYIGNKSIINTDSENTGEPFFIQWENYYDGELNRFWFSENGEHTIAINELVSGELKQLDEKFIPGSIARTEKMKSRIDSNELRISTVEDNFNNLSKEVSINTSTKMTYGTTVEIPLEFNNESYLCHVAVDDENGKMAIIGFYGGVIYSIDGIHWEYTKIGAYLAGYDYFSVNDAIYANNKFIAVGKLYNKTTDENVGVIAYSTDAIKWNCNYIRDVETAYSIAYGNEKFVVATGSNKIITSIDGISWTVSTVSIPRTSGIAYGNNKFVMIYLSNSGLNIFYSTDADNWTSAGLINDNGIKKFKYYNNKFIILSDGEYLSYSENGIDWTSISVPTGVKNFACGDNKVLLYGDNSDIYYVTDLKNILQCTTPLEDLNYITYGNGKFIAISSASSIAVYSIDGIHWGHILQNSKDITKEIKGLVLDEYLKMSNNISSPNTASVGQTLVVKAVDETGRPTDWETVNLPKQMVVNITGDENNNPIADKTFDEIKEAYDSGIDVICSIYDGISFRYTYHLSIINSDFARFSNVSVSDQDVRNGYIYIYSDGTVVISEEKGYCMPWIYNIKVGNIIRINEVDSNGMVTSFESVDPWVLTDETTSKKYRLSVVDGKLTMNAIESEV